jgi:hypothetical protein
MAGMSGRAEGQMFLFSFQSKAPMNRDLSECPISTHDTVGLTSCSLKFPDAWRSQLWYGSLYPRMSCMHCVDVLSCRCF